MEYRLRGKSYPFVNSSDTLLSKVAIAMQHGMADWEDDARVAYAVSSACPDVPTDIVSYQPPNNFKMTLDTLEIAAFMISLNIVTLERTKIQSDGDKIALERKIKELKKTLFDFEKGLTSDQVKLILGQIEITKTETGEEVELNAPLDPDLKSAEVDDEDFDNEPLTHKQQIEARRLLRNAKKFGLV
jgi:hypothetical protein